MENPYSASIADPSVHSQGQVTPAMIQALQGTKPWVRFCSILGFIFTGLIMMGAVSMIFFGSLMSGSMSETEVGMPFAGFSILMSAVYILLGLLYLFPSIKLWKFGSRIVDLIGSQSTQDLEAALDAQRSFWKLVGILLAVFIGLYIIIIGIAVVVGIFGTMSSI